MVVSQIDKTVHYVENKKIDEEDRGFATSLFEIEILGKDIVIGIGKEKHTYQHRNIVFFPIYLVANNAIKSKIGVYEMKATDVISNLDEDGDINIQEFEPLLFSFVKLNFLEKSGSSPEYYYNLQLENAKKENEKSKENNEKDDLKKENNEKDNTKKKKDEDSNNEKDDTKKENQDNKDDEDNIRKISTKMQGGKSTNEKTNDAFEIDSDKNIPDLLPEESESDADELVKQYVAMPGHNWIKKFMENGEYELVSNECSDADSVYCFIRDAFSQIGHKTTVAKLRDLVSKEITEEFYEKCLDMHLIYSTEVARLDKEMRDIKKAVGIFKVRIETSTNKDDHKAIIKSAEEQKEKYKELAITKKIADAHAAEYAFMKDIKTVDDMRKKNIPAIDAVHEFIIQTIEKEFNIKIIGLLQDAFDHGDSNAVVQCYGKDHANPRPKHYLIMSHSMKHKKCELVSYKGKRIFVFGELPYHMKTLVVNKCLENNGGTFPLIADFRNFMNKLGVKIRNDDDDDTNANNVNNDIFLFYAKSSNFKPGNAKGEHIDDVNLTEYFNLERAKGWRQMLDDSYETPFKLDKMQWQTVEHYYQGSKFKKRNPDFYKVFSLDSDSEISKDLKKAIEAGNTKGKGRPKNISIDPDFYGLDGGRSKEERRIATMAKFNQNEDLCRVLLNTGKSTLKQYRKGEPFFTDLILMDVRKAIR